MYTKEGNPINLTKDLLHGLPTYNNNTTTTNNTTPTHALGLQFNDIIQWVDVLEKFEKGIHQFLSLQDQILFLLIRDAGQFNEREFTDDSITVQSRKGRSKISIEEYIKVVQSIQPDITTAMSVDIPYETSNKKVNKSIKTTLNWLSTLLSKLDNDKKKSVFGVIHNIKNEDLLMILTKDTVKQDVGGFILGSFGTGESVQNRETSIEKIVKLLPKDKPRLISGLGTPEEILSLVELGVDLFSTNYPNLVTEWGYALTFEYNFEKLQQQQQSNNANEDNNEGEDNDSKMNLWNTKYVIDTQPIIKGCPCFTCTQHTRAYIHHLLNTHEMLAEVLLTIHNISHYIGFFSEIRKSISSSNFKLYKQLFLKQRSS
eukprot:gene4562-5685_t